MRVTAILALIASFLAFVACLLAVVGARLAERQAKQAMKLATEALAAARAAGASAEASRDAMSDLQSAEPERPDDGVHWSIRWDQESGVLNIANVGSARAGHVSAVIHGKKIHKPAHALGDCEAGEQVSVELPEIVDLRLAHDKKKSDKEFKPKVTLGLTWSSEDGHPQSKNLNLVLG